MSAPLVNLKPLRVTAWLLLAAALSPAIFACGAHHNETPVNSVTVNVAHGSSSEASEIDQPKTSQPTFFEANADETRTLIHHGADINQRNADGDTALFGADSLKAVTLLNANAQVEARNTLGQTPLIYNCVQGNNDAVLVLLARSASVSGHDVNGTTPFLAGAAHCRLETLRALVHAGSKLNAKKKDGTTALMYSLYNPDDRVFYWLLKRSPDLNARGMGNNTALSIAQQLQDQAKATGASTARFDKVIQALQKLGAH